MSLCDEVWENERKTNDDIAEDRTMEGVGLKLVGDDIKQNLLPNSVFICWLIFVGFFAEILVTVQYKKYNCIVHSSWLLSQIWAAGSHQVGRVCWLCVVID